MHKKILFLFLFSALILGGCGKNNKNSIDIKGSDTLLQLVSSLSESFMEKYPEIEVTVTGGGSGTGLASLLNKEIVLANSSRDIKEKEIEAAKSKKKEFKRLVIARDGLSIIAHKDNLIEKLNIEQVADIFKGSITNWQELGGEDKEINLYGRQSTSGTYEFMKDEVLFGDYSSTMRNMEGNQAIVDAIKEDIAGIGYVGIAYAASNQDDIKILSIALDSGEEYFDPLNTYNINNGNYPITRPLYQFILELPKLNSALHEFLKYEVSDEALKIIEEVGYFSPNEEDKLENQKLFSQIEKNVE